MQYTIRKMTANDIQHIQDVARTSWRVAYEGIIPAEVQNRFLQTAYSDEMMRRRLDLSHLYVAEANGIIVGFANFSAVRGDGTAELSAIYVDPQHQGCGIGSALLREGIQQSSGMRELHLHVEKDNIAGRRFYEAKQFEAAGEHEELLEGHRLRTVRMILKI